MQRTCGRYERLGSQEHYIPDPLPPQNPPLQMSQETTALYGQAMQWLSKLNEATTQLPDNMRFIKAYVIKEALLSSSIEGIHTTLIDVFTQPLLSTKPKKETQLVINYTKALDVALRLMQVDGLPISNRVILQAHQTLMQHGEGDKANPGQYRKQSVRVGSLIPAPANYVPELMTDLEKFINNPNSLPPLIKVGLTHVQFETIHPFLDGNGRIGRLLIVLMLIEYGLLDTPILYPSYYFKKHHMAYYHHLDAVRKHGNFEEWINFFLEGIVASSRDAYQRVKDIKHLEKECIAIIQSDQRFAKVQRSALTALAVLFKNPVIGIPQLAQKIERSYNATKNLVDLFVAYGFLQEEQERKRNKLYRFTLYLDVLQKEYS